MLIFKQAIKRIMINKARIIIMLLMPIIFILAFAGRDQNEITIGIVDKNQSKMSGELINQIADMSKVKIKKLNYDSMITQTIKGKVDYAVVINKDFQSKVIAGKHITLDEYYNQEKDKIHYIRLFMKTYIQDMQYLAQNAGNQKKVFEKALAIYKANRLRINNKTVENDSIAQSRSAMGFLVQFMLYMSVITAILIIEDKTSGVFFRICSSPMKLRSYILQYMLAFLMIGIMQEAIILVLIKVLFNMSLGTAPILMFILFAVFSLVCVSLGILLVSVLKKAIHAYIAIILLTTPMVMLGGCYWESNLMPEFMQKIALFIPTTWVMKEVDNLLIGSWSCVEVCKSIGILLIFSIVFLIIGMMKKVEIGK
ncbi:ABC-2 type transporter [Streptococcus mutans 15VF2]|uniref:ABC transporter permease n=1 Tax=Streptococcus mutans TaxID=1309 RepID=UPI0002B59BC4|nr:ABC transporter permease [Streptococcus mutans]EMB75028.1 ABC-2 type transporter [Streptococcus mutans 15VF2]